MKKAELIQKIEEINQKIESIESLNEKLNKANTILQSVGQGVADLEQRRSVIEGFQGQIGSIKEEVSQFKQTIESIAKTANEYSETVKKQTEEYDNLKNQIGELLKQNVDLHETIKNQLGLVSMEILATSFFDEAGKLKKSMSKWFWWLFGSIVVLFTAVLGIAIWQVAEEQALFKLGFLIRLPLITPVIFFVFFTAKQFTRDRKLLDEYTFKASVARSFEAYRKILREESISDDATYKQKFEEKKIDFIINSIADIYKSPMESINKVQEDKDNIQIPYLDQVADIFKKFIK